MIYCDAERRSSSARPRFQADAYWHAGEWQILVALWFFQFYVWRVRA